MSAILLGILIAGAIVAIPVAIFLVIHIASRDDSAGAPVPPPQSGWGTINPTASAAPPAVNYPQASQIPSWLAAPTAAPSAPSQPAAGPSSAATVIGNLIRTMAGPNMDAVTILSQISTQIQMENQGKNLTRAERQQLLVKALDDMAARDPGNETVQKIRDSIRRAMNGAGTQAESR